MKPFLIFRKVNPMITKEQFKNAVGHEPTDDDLDRCNCPLVGCVGHLLCGWNEKENKPMFMTGYIHKNEEVIPNPV